ncbi:hypothetical protein EOM82_05795, partial [bacterium]|nr:hypothetical protein [bacterium]
MFSDGVTTYAYSAYGPKIIYVFSGGKWSIRTLEAVPGDNTSYASADTVFIGGIAYDTYSFGLMYQINSYESVVYFDENAFIAGNKVYSSVTGEPFGEYNASVVSVSRDGNSIYIVYSDGKLEKVVASGLYGAAPVNVVITGKKLVTRVYEYTIPLSSGGDIKSAVFDNSSGNVAVLRNGDNRLYFINPNDWSLNYTVHLKYVPLSLIHIEGGVAVLFSKVNKVYLTATKEYISFPAKVSSFCVCDGRLFAVCGGKVCEYNRTTGTISYPFGQLEADGIACSNGKLYVSTVYDVTGYDIKTFVPFAVCQAMYSGNVAAWEDHVIAGNFIYSADTLDFSSAVIGKVFDFRGNMLLTDTGMFSLSEGKYITGYMSNPIQAVIMPDFTTLLFGQVSVTVINSQGYDPTNPAVVTGVSEDGVYNGGVSVHFDRGTAFMDGKKIENGYTETKAGNHTLTVVTSWNIYTIIKFTVKYNPASLVIQNGNIRLSVGQTATLKTKIYPEGASGNVVFTTESDNIRVTSSGVVFAVAEGESVVRASISGTDIYTNCTIYVTSSKAVCTNSDYIIDKGNGVLGGVSPGTTADVFLSYFLADECRYAVADKAGNEITEGIVATGMNIIRYDLKGVQTDSLVISVTGDLDGDGVVTINDADILYRYLLLNYELENCIFYAADCNANLRITAVDLKALRLMLDYSAVGAEGNDELYVNIPLFGYIGSDFYVTIQNDKIGKSGSVAGVINYDTDKLSVVKITPFGGEVYTSDYQGKLEYCVLGADNLGEKAKLLRVYFRIKENALPGVTYLDFNDTSVSRGVLYGVKQLSETFEIKETPAEKLTVASSNSLLKFRHDVYEYSVLIPYGDEFLNLSFDCPVGCYVYFNNLPVYGDSERRLTLTYLNQKGEIAEYTIKVSHGEEYIPENNSLLQLLEASGLEITPVFDPSVTAYTAEAEYGMVTQITAIPAGKHGEVNVSGPETLSVGDNTFVITCTAEDGTQKIYTFARVKA